MQESPDGRDGSSSPVFPAPGQVTRSGNANPPEQQTDARGGCSSSSERPCPRHCPARRPEGPQWPPGARTAAWPRLHVTPFPSTPGPGWASPPGLREGSFQKGSAGSHSAPRRAQGLESTRGPWGLRARQRRPVQPFVGNRRARAALHWRQRKGRDSDSGGLPHPTHTRAHPTRRSPLPSLGHPHTQPKSSC